LRDDVVKHDIILEMDGNTPTMIFHSHQETQPIVDNVKRLTDQMEAMGRHIDPEKFRLAAQIPVVLYFKWRREWQETYSQDMPWDVFKLKKLNSDEFKNLRVGGKKI
ncbi:MAG: hypothetical protein R3330_12485, partial [Saprospiraceae bacterium]|nr:hypothetical protein [Saprospiraceae bacterium]